MSHRWSSQIRGEVSREAIQAIRQGRKNKKWSNGQDTTNDQADLGAVASYRNGRAAMLLPEKSISFLCTQSLHKQ